MPYVVRKRGSKFCVETKGTGRNHGCHDSVKDAQAQQRALYANTEE